MRQLSSTLVKVKSRGSSSSPSDFSFTVRIKLPSQEADELLAAHVLAVGLGGEQVGGINAAGSHLGEELLDQGIDAAGVEHQLHGVVDPVPQQGETPGQQSFAADLPHQYQLSKQGRV